MKENNMAADVLIPVPDADAMADGDVRRICSEAAGGPIALFRVADGFHAIADTCSHGHASLAEGWLEGFEIECPVHSGRFDVRTGAPLAFPVTEPVRTFPTRRVDGVLSIVVSG